MEDLMIEDIILILKPLCHSFMNEPTVEKITKIGILVDRTPNTIIQKFCEEVLYPITYHVKSNTLSKDENLKLIETIRVIISKIRIQNLKLFYEIYYCLRIQICQQKNTMELIETHEELKEIVVLCLNDLINNSSISIIESFYTRQNAALLSHGIYLCVAIARLEKCISLRLSAIKTIMTLLQVHKEAETQDVVLRNQIADVIMLYLPGIVSGLLEVALGSDVQNHKITMMAIQVWSRALILVMQDVPQEQKEQNIVALPPVTLENLKSKDPKTIEKIKHILETAKRTPDWYATVSEKFKVIFTELDILTKHSHFKVRKELAEAVGLLLLNCSGNMKACIQNLLEILITLSEDENSQVCEEARKVLKKVQDKFFEDSSMKSVIEMVEENLYNLLMKMPRIIRTSEESLQLLWLNRLAGYLKILGKQRLSRILLSTAHLQKLLLSLIYVAELDNSNVSLLEEITTTNFEETVYHEVSCSWKQYKFLFDSTCIEKLNYIFKILGELGDQKTLVDSIFKMTIEMPRYKKEFILILNTILKVPADSEIQMSICKQVVENYISNNNWDVPVNVSEEVTLQIARNNIIQCCLLLEGLGNIAKVLQEKYQEFLLKTLYIIIERAGSKHSLLRYVGLSTLEIITKSQKLDTVGDLFRVNCDYISYHVTVKLRRVERNPGVLDVVEVVTNYSTMDFLPQLKDIVYDLFYQFSSKVQKHNTQCFLKVFLAFVICVKKLTSNNDPKQNEKAFDKSKVLTPAQIVINNFLEYYNAEKNSRLYENNDDDNDAECEIDENSINKLKDELNAEGHDFYEDEKKKDPPYYIIMVQDIMKRCLNYVPSQDFNESSLSMLILKEGAYILKDSENVLLPIVHELWHPLVHRFQNSNLLIINQAFQLLSCLSQVAEDFIRGRTLKEVLPSLSSFLKTAAKESYKKDSSYTYKFTQMFKLQREILSQLGSIVTNLKLQEKHVWDTLDTAECYLHSKQHSQLQRCCIDMYKDISEYNADLVWIKCVDIWNRQVETVSLKENLDQWYLKVIDYPEKSHYQRNVLQILTHIHAKRVAL